MFVSHRTKRFRAQYGALPEQAQRQANAAYTLFKRDPHHPSLQFKGISASDPSVYSVRIGAHYRVIGLVDGNVVTWIWIGTHEAYNNLKF